jgi:hypothetical protein
VGESADLLGPAEQAALDGKGWPLGGEFICSAYTTLSGRSGK